MADLEMVYFIGRAVKDLAVPAVKAIINSFKIGQETEISKRALDKMNEKAALAIREMISNPDRNADFSNIIEHLESLIGESGGESTERVRAAISMAKSSKKESSSTKTTKKMTKKATKKMTKKAAKKMTKKATKKGTTKRGPTKKVLRSKM